MRESGRPPVGVLIGGPSLVPERISELARISEELGFTELWVPEDYFYTGAIAAATLALTATTRVPVGIGIVSAVVRHPAVLAMELSTIARTFPGRAWPGIALGLPVWLRQMGVHPRSMLTALRETVTSLRALLEGAEVTIRGQDFDMDAIRLEYPVSPTVPLYMGARGPKMLRLAGEIADGTIMAWPCSPGYVTWARQYIEEGRRRGGRVGENRVPCFCLFSIDDDGAKAKAAIRPALAWALTSIGRCPPTDVLGISEELVEMIARDGATTVEREMPERWLDELAIAGTPQECAEKVQRYIQAGADSVVLYPYRTDLAADLLEQFAAKTVPLLSNEME